MPEDLILEPRVTRSSAHSSRRSALASLTTRAHRRVQLSASQPSAIFAIQGLGATALPLQGVEHTLLPIGPNRCMVVGEQDAPQQLEEAFGSLPDTVMTTDVSHAWCRLIVEGEGVRELLQSGIGLDLSPALWPVGRSTATAFREVQVVLHASGPDRFDLYTFRSVALCLWQWLDDGAAGL